MCEIESKCHNFFLSIIFVKVLKCHFKMYSCSIITLSDILQTHSECDHSRLVELAPRNPEQVKGGSKESHFCIFYGECKTVESVVCVWDFLFSCSDLTRLLSLSFN